MNTVRKSAAQELKDFFQKGLTPAANERSSWRRLGVGDKVCRYEDPRHVGIIDAIRDTATVRVFWEGGGAGAPNVTEVVTLRELRKTRKGE